MKSDVKKSLKSVCNIYFKENADVVFDKICEKYKDKDVTMSTLITEVMKERDNYGK